MSRVRSILPDILPVLAFYMVLGLWWAVDVTVRGMGATESVAPIILFGHVGYTLLTFVVYGTAVVVVCLLELAGYKDDPLPEGVHDPFNPASY